MHSALTAVQLILTVHFTIKTRSSGLGEKLEMSKINGQTQQTSGNQKSTLSLQFRWAKKMIKVNIQLDDFIISSPYF